MKHEKRFKTTQCFKMSFMYSNGGLKHLGMVENCKRVECRLYFDVTIKSLAVAFVPKVKVCYHSDWDRRGHVLVNQHHLYRSVRGGRSKTTQKSLTKETHHWWEGR